MSLPKARFTSLELCDRAHPGALGYPRWTKPHTRTVDRLARIGAAITIGPNR